MFKAIKIRFLVKLKEWFLKDELAIYNFETDRLKERFITENISRTALSFLYFPYYNMVAVIWNYPSSDKLNQLFDDSFYFQNGSDQNYNNGLRVEIFRA